jgi:Carboxypeptidase regulatory-like domain
MQFPAIADVFTIPGRCALPGCGGRVELEGEKMHTLRFVLGSVSLLLAATFALAQTGSIQGTVTDSGGAVVQGAEVTTKNLGSNAVRTVTSSGTGAYSVPALPPGAYDVTVRMASFKTFHVADVQLTVGQVLGLNVQLQPGPVAEEVEVRADQISDVDLETSQVSNLVDERAIKALPLITRNPYELVLLSPGTAQTNTGLGGVSVNGSRERNNNFLLDGVDNNDTSVPGGLGGVLSATPDSTQEFRVITNNFNAEYGRNTGAIIDVVTKSGTNSFHGNAYEFGRWNAFGGARDWFNRTDAGKQDPYVRNQFGYSIGGPIIKDKTFFFFNHELDRFRTTLTNNATVPTAAFKTGVFNYLGDPVDLTQAGANNGTGNSLVGNPAGNAPPDPTMQRIFALYPNPTIDNGNGLTGTLFFPSTSAQNSYTTVAKIDHHFTDRETFSVRYGYDDLFDPNPNHADVLPGNVGGFSLKAIQQGLSANLTSSLRTNLINSFTFGWNRIFAKFDCTGTSVLDGAIPAVDQFGNGWDVNMSPFTSFGCLALVSDGQFRKTGTTSFTDGLSWSHGNHTFKFGGDFRNVGESGPNGFFSRRQVTVSGLLTGFGIHIVQGVPSSDLNLETAAQAFYGIVDTDFQAEFFDKSGARKATDDKKFRQHEYDWYGQDTWKIRRNLTLTLGLRYQLDGVPYEENANFSNLLGDPTAGPVTLTVVGPGTGKQIYASDYSNLEPRVGFSWDPKGDGKMAVRAAFGIFHDRVFGNLFGNARGNPPFEQDYNRFPVDTVNGFYGGSVNGPFVLPAPPNTTPSPVIPNFDPVTGAGALAPVLFDPHFRNAASNNWNFGIQRELGGNNVLDLAYVGSQGHHIYRELDPNSPVPSLVKQLVAFCGDPTNSLGCTPDNVSFTNLYIGAERGVLPFNAVAHNALLQPFFQTSVGNSIYNSLQAKFTHRLKYGIQLQAAYTWSHAIDNSNDPLAPAAGNRGFPRNSRQLNEERGNSDNDIRQVAVINYQWELPFGKGKGYLNSGVMGKVFEGWQLSGITTVQTGHPFDVFSSTDMERTGLSGRADLIGDPYAPGANTPSTSGGNKVWFTNPAAFSGRTDGSFAPLFIGPGTSGRNSFYGPGFVNFDLVFAKTTKITERINAELRVEGYNIFNHPHFNNPGTDLVSNRITASNFGLINSTATRPDATTSARQLQVALKLNF